MILYFKGIIKHERQGIIMRIAVIGIGGVGGIVSSALKKAEDSLVLVCR